MNIASIDIGTNTVILLISEITDGKFSTLCNEFRIPRIGKGLIPGVNITDKKIKELLNVLADYKKLIKQYNCSKVLAIATNAFRIASNSREIICLIKSELEIDIEIISGEEEAEYSFLGAVSDYSTQDFDILVIDIGGGSTELILGNRDKIKYKDSFRTGVVIGTEKFFKCNPPLPAEINNFVNHLYIIFKELNLSKPAKTIAIAGTPTTLACIQKRLTFYDEDEVEGSILKIEDIKILIKDLSLLSSAEIATKYKSIVTGREDVLLAGTIILSELMTLLKIPEVVVSTKGIRYGVIYKRFKDVY